MFSAGQGHDPTKMYQTPFLLEHYVDLPFTDATWLGQKLVPNSILLTDQKLNITILDNEWLLFVTFKNLVVIVNILARKLGCY